MKRLFTHIALLTFAAFPILVLSQEETSQQVIEAIIESRLERLDEGTDVALIIEDLESMAENPININSTNAAELSRLYLLDAIQINRLLEYTETFGAAYSIFELQSIDGFTRDLLQKMAPFIYFGEAETTEKSLQQELKNARHQVLLRTLGYLQESRGYKPNKNDKIPFEGNRFRYYTRYLFETSEKLSFGITAEKDPGEAFFSNSNKQGFDFYSGHFSIKPNKTIEQITVGDFIVRAGQGLVLWQGYTSGKSEDVMGISKNGQGIRGYTSVDENFYFRGLASALNLGKSKLQLFYSQKNMDANLVYTDSLPNHFTSLQTSGYHRTQNEIADKNAIKSINAGGIYTLRFNNFKLGATFVFQQFNIPYLRSAQLYNLFRFSGTENYTGGMDYLYNKGKYQLFGEAAVSKSKGKAFVQGARIHVNDQLSFSALFRHFDKDYHALWANTFAEGSNISNESGLYFGVRFLPAKYITLSAYSDVYQSNWVNYTTAGPAKAWDIFAQAAFHFSEKFNFYVRYKNEEKEQKNKAAHQYINLPERTQKTRAHFQYQPSERITLKTRFEHTYFHAEGGENGFLVFQDFQYAPTSFPLKLSARVAWFSTESYNSRIYAYENDILYTFSIPAYYGKGLRTYLNLSYKISDKLTCWVKAGNTLWTDRETISSGYGEIEGSNKSDLKIQLRLKF